MRPIPALGGGLVEKIPEFPILRSLLFPGRLPPMKNLCVLLVLALTLATVPGLSQTVTATVHGVISDSSGGMVVGAHVMLTNRDTRVIAFSGNSDSAGRYTASAIPPGAYTISAEHPGFKRMDIPNVELTVGQTAEVDLRLSPGETTQSITVTAEVVGAHMDTNTSSVSTLITPSDVTDIPLPTRDPMNLLTLVAGVSTGGTGGAVNTSMLSINGSRTLNTEVRLDGTSVLESNAGIVSPLPSPDALQEFRIQTSAYSAESGRTSGGTVTAMVKSGTNVLHGSGYELFRNELMDANQFFNNNRSIPRQADHYNQFGAALGGPIIIPKIYNGRNKTFFFYNIDQTIAESSSTPTNSVPSAAFKSGDFSSASIAVYDPLSNTPFPGNVIPSTRLDPVAMKVMSLVPLPNTGGTPDPQNSRSINNYVYPQKLLATDPKNTGKIDQTIGERIRMFGSVNSWATNSPVGATVPSGILNDSAIGDTRHGYETSYGLTLVNSPTFVTEIHFGFNRWVDEEAFASTGPNVAQALGIGRSLIICRRESPSPAISRLGRIRTRPGIPKKIPFRQVG